MSATTLDSLSARRSAAVLEIPLDEAIETLRELALGAEIRYSNHVLRVLHEFERSPGLRSDEKLPTFITLVDPNVPDAYRLHAVDPRSDERKTFCGVGYGGWKNIGIISTRADLTDRTDICRRCRHSLELAMNRGS